jgi:serine protease
MTQQLSKRPAVLKLGIATVLAVSGSAAIAHVTAENVMASAVDRLQQTDRIIIKYKDVNPSSKGGMVLPAMTASRLAAIQTVGKQHGITMRTSHTIGTGAHVVKLDRKIQVGEVHAIATEIMAKDPSVEYAEPDRMMHAMLTPNDTRYSEQWDLYETTAGMRLPAAWDKSTGSGVTVAVIDTGYRPHADLKANIVAGGGYDMISDTTVSGKAGGRQADAIDPGDWTTTDQCYSGSPGSNSSWHGTHVSGTIAAATNNSTGVAGIAYNAKILPVRVLGHCGGYTSDIADAMIWASGGAVSGVPANATPAKVLSLSLGGGGACDTTTQSAINSARSRGAVVVVAAGNENQDASNSNPANCSGVIAVAAVNRSGGRAWYSNYGSIVDVAAPGGDTSVQGNGILSTLNTGATTPGSDSYEFYQGTSMATPHVSAVAALMLAKNPNLTPDDIESKLKSSARPFPATCTGCGAGIVDASAAVDAATGATSTTAIAEVEPNNSPSAAQAVTARGTTINGTMSSSTDTDYYAIQLPAGGTLTATLTPNSTSDYDLYVYNSSGTLIGRSENVTGSVDSVSVVNAGSSTFTRYIRVVYYSGGTGPTGGKYALKLAW